MKIIYRFNKTYKKECKEFVNTRFRKRVTFEFGEARAVQGNGLWAGGPCRFLVSVLCGKLMTVYSIIHSFNRHLLCTFYVSDTLLVAVDTGVNQRGENSVL